MKKRIILPALLLSLLICGCKGVHCYGVDDIEYYYPYQKDDQLLFENEAGDTVYFNVGFVIKPKEEDLGWFCKCWCESYYMVHLLFSQSDTMDWSNVNDFLDFHVIFDNAVIKGEMDLSMEEKWGEEKINGVSRRLKSIYSNDTLLFVAQDSLYFDSVWVVKDLGFTSFCTSDGHRYQNVSSLQMQRN